MFLRSIRLTSSFFSKIKLNSRGKSFYSSVSNGLFGLSNLESHQGFHLLTREAMEECERRKRSILSSPPSLQTIRDLDSISNSICSVIDAAELCRNVHPNEKFRESANKCFTLLSDYIQQLNTDVELYRCLRRVTDDTFMMSTFSKEQCRMAMLLRAEFERDGIHLSDGERKNVMKLQNELTRLGMVFQHTIQTARDYIQIPADSLRAVPYSLLSQCETVSSYDKTLLVPTDTHIMNGVLKWVRSPSIRKAVYVAGNKCAKANLKVLDEIIKKRHELALALGFKNYAHLATSDKMAGKPEIVHEFLDTLAKKLMKKAEMEKRILLRAKREHEGSHVEDLYGWDLPFYMGMLKARKFNLDARVISSYFELSRCLNGLGLICKDLFGMTLRPIEMKPNESWHPDVQKMVLEHDKDGPIGYIYFDLYPRPNKYTHAAHFTICCGKNETDHSKGQLPVVALVCNFNRPMESHPSLLTHAEVETLFHEFGHAMHSLLSRTEFQHLSGTRAQLDFVETPSHLFEYFAWDYRVVSKFARHYETEEVIPEDMMNNLRQSKNMFAAIDALTQTVYSLLDLVLFQDQPLPFNPPTTTQVLKSLQNRYMQVPYTEDTYWHTRFGHLIGYGAGYYSYLYARVFSSQIWDHCFAKNPLDRQTGERVWRSMMIHGGARDPHEILRDLLNEDPSIDSFLKELGIENKQATKVNFSSK